jgi:hypothetical protein
MHGWTPADFADSDGNQSMRALAISSDGTKIYVGTSGYQGPNKTPNIYLIGPASTTPVKLATLPSYVEHVTIRRGIAGMDLDEVHNAVFASNFADGIIYRKDAATGGDLGSFDPLTPYAATTTLPPLGERVIALAYNKVENRLYYSLWGGGNNIRSVGLTAAGAFDPPTDRLEFTLGGLVPVADIEFNNAGNKMLLAQEELFEISNMVVINAHNARAMEYAGGTGTWSLDPTNYDGSGRKYSIGSIFNLNNCRGGVAWAYSNITGGVINGNENFVIFTGDALRFATAAAVYGLQYTPATGGAAGGGVTSNSLIADLDYEVINLDKNVYGDVDVRRSLTTTAAMVSVSGRVLTGKGTGMPGVSVMLIGPDGTARTALTNGFGYYLFENVLAGEAYVVAPSAKNHHFEPLLLTVLAEITDANFIDE